MAITFFNENGGIDYVENYVTFAEGVYRVDDEWTYHEFDTIDQVIEHFRAIDGDVSDFADIAYIDMQEVNELRNVDVKKIVEEDEDYDEEEGVEVGSVTLMYKLPFEVTFEIKDNCVDFKVVDECGTMIVKGKAKTIEESCNEICEVLNTKHRLSKLGERFEIDEDDIEEYDDNVYVCSL